MFKYITDIYVIIHTFYILKNYVDIYHAICLSWKTCRSYCTMMLFMPHRYLYLHSHNYWAMPMLASELWIEFSSYYSNLACWKGFPDMFTILSVWWCKCDHRDVIWLFTKFTIRLIQWHFGNPYGLQAAITKSTQQQEL